jgi:hypothetical protein
MSYDRECVICFFEYDTSALFPCCHQAICQTCMVKVQTLYTTCPFCRTRLQDQHRYVLEVEDGLEDDEEDVEMIEPNQYGICKRLFCVWITMSVLTLSYFFMYKK